MNKVKVLLVEDDPNLGVILGEYLEIKGFEVVLCPDGESGLDAFRQDNFDLCIFDVMMPKKDGFSLAEEVRQISGDVPIIFLTAKSMKEDTIYGFKVGADDYIKKPFSMEELLLRINAILRRTQREAEHLEQESSFTIGGYFFDYDRQLLIWQDKEEQRLTSKEAELLRQLCLHKNHVLDRSKALKKIWGEDNYYNSRSMDVYITKLRKFLKSDPNVQIINVHSQGFKLLEMK